MLHHAAFEQRNPKHLSGIYADLQASVFAIVQQIMQTILADGVKMAKPVYYTDKEGQIVVAEYMDEEGHRRILMENVFSHPLFKPLGELLSRANLTLADMGMTVKVIEAEEQEMGRLVEESESRESMADYQRRQVNALEGLRDVFERARVIKQADPVLIEYQEQNSGG